MYIEEPEGRDWKEDSQALDSVLPKTQKNDVRKDEMETVETVDAQRSSACT
jgi:hypothetical protein